MEIIKKSKETFTPKELYVLTMSPETRKMKDAISQTVEIGNYCLYKDNNSKGEEHNILAISTPDGECIATNSPTFIEDFFRMQDMFAGCGEVVKSVKVISGTSKAGREFITCAYAD